MTAVVFDEPTGFDALHTAELTSSAPGPGEVAVKITAATINPVDTSVVRSGAGADLPGDPPHVLGWDAAGTVSAVGGGVDATLVGKRVLVFANWFESGQGLQRDKAVVGEDQVAVVNTPLSDAELASLGLNGLTALEAVNNAGLGSADVLAVAGAQGDVGRLAVAIAQHKGLTTVGIGRNTSDSELSDIGARTLIGAAPTDPRWLAAVRDGGTVLALNGSCDSERGITVKSFGVRRKQAAMEELAELIEDGVLTPNVGATYTAAQAAQAYHHFAEEQTDHARVVLTF